MTLLRTLWAALQGRPDGVEEIDAQAARALQERGSCLLVDIREPHEYAAEHIPGSVSAPLSRFEDGLPRNRDTEAVFLCLSGMRTRLGAARFAAAGFRKTYLLRGGIQAWKRAGLPTRKA